MDFWDFRGAYKPAGGRVGVRTGGAGRKRCTKGKSCGATCIAAEKDCWVDLPGGKPGSQGGKNLHDATSKVRDLIASRTGGKAPTSLPVPSPSAPVSPAKPALEPKQVTPEVKPTPQKTATPTEKPEPTALEKAKALLKQSVAEQIKKSDAKAGGSPISEEQKKINKRQDDTKLTGDQSKAIRTYTSDKDIRGVNQYQNVNNCLRNPSACANKGEAEALQKALDSALSALPKNTDNIEFTRVIPVTSGTQQLYNFLKNSTPGTTLKDPGYGSFSSDKAHAQGLAKYGKNIVMVTKSGQIVPVNQYSLVKDEMEGILPRGSSLKIMNVKEDANGLTVTLED
jgi:hypothetical protein